MRNSTASLIAAIASGVNRIGEIMIQSNDSNDCFHLFHNADAPLATAADFGGLEVFLGPGEARRISLYTASDDYRFLKAQRNLRRGWLIVLDSPSDLRLALDHFYPAALGMWLSHREGRLQVEHLREKLDRQTGMYRRARIIGDERAQVLVPGTCAAGPGCARRILWAISPTLPLIPSPATTCTGIASGVAESDAIPLLCAAPCNHFIAECLAASKQPTPPPIAP
jgi:hypothetical protein